MKLKRQLVCKALFYYLLCLLLHASCAIRAQDTVISANKFCPEFNFYTGYIIPAYPGVPKSLYMLGASGGFFWQTRGGDNWHSLYNFPKFGAEVLYVYNGNSEELGYSISLVPQLELRSLNEKKKWRVRLGFGAAYFNKPYHAYSNPANYYIGSHFTNMSIFSYYQTISLTQQTIFSLGVSVLHSSNGHTALPNAGMNIVSLHTLLSFRNSVPAKKEVNRKDSLRYRGLAIKAGLGFHEFGPTSKPVGGPTYPSWHLSTWYNKAYSMTGIWQAGFSWAYYSSFYDYITSQMVYEHRQKLKSCTGIVFAGHEWVMGKVGFIAQAGIYFYNPFYIKQKKLEGSWDNLPDKIEAVNTNRLGLVYYPLKKRNSLTNLRNQLQLGAFIKANLAQADLFEYSAAFVF